MGCSAEIELVILHLLAISHEKVNWEIVKIIESDKFLGLKLNSSEIEAEMIHFVWELIDNRSRYLTHFSFIFDIICARTQNLKSTKKEKRRVWVECIGRS